MKKKKVVWDFPPDVFWITPEGKVIEVIGHLTAIRSDPEFFGFAFPPRTESEVDKVFMELLTDHWIRGRVSGNKVYFQVGAVNRRVMDIIIEFLMAFRDHIDNVIIESAYPVWRSWELPIEDILEDRYPVAWRLNPKKKGGKR